MALWIAAGASPDEIAARAGHRSVVTVLDRYGHLFPDGRDDVTDELDRMAASRAWSLGSDLADMGYSPYTVDVSFDLATHIRQLREELGWTQEDLAGRAHIDQGDLSRIERGATDPRWSTVNRIINALGETLSTTAAPTTVRPALTAETRQAIRAQAKPRRSKVRVGAEARLPVKR